MLKEGRQPDMVEKKHTPRVSVAQSIVYICICVCVYISVCVYVCVYVCICICVHRLHIGVCRCKFPTTMSVACFSVQLKVQHCVFTEMVCHKELPAAVATTQRQAYHFFAKKCHLL